MGVMMSVCGQVERRGKGEGRRERDIISCYYFEEKREGMEGKQNNVVLWNQNGMIDR